jgi:hypothetical protein
MHILYILATLGIRDEGEIDLQGMKIELILKATNKMQLYRLIYYS